MKVGAVLEMGRAMRGAGRAARSRAVEERSMVGRGKEGCG
jgi:hypothetical protein